MIVGVINARGEPAVRLRLFGPTGRFEEILAAIDTGFNGAFSLPPTLVEWLSLETDDMVQVHLADGSSRPVQVYAVGVLWDGSRREVTALAMGDAVLLGMALLKGHRLTIDAVENGAVTIAPIA